MEVLEHNEEEKRPTLLLVLGILSLISIGFSILFSLIGLAGGPLSEDEIIQQRVEMVQSKKPFKEANMDGMVVFFDKMEAMLEETNENFYFSKGVLFVTDFIGLFGVIFMLRRRKLGFHMYIMYSLLALGGMFLYVSAENVHIVLTVVNVIIAGLFIFLYSRTVSWMR